MDTNAVFMIKGLNSNPFWNYCKLEIWDLKLPSLKFNKWWLLSLRLNLIWRLAYINYRLLLWFRKELLRLSSLLLSSWLWKEGSSKLTIIFLKLSVFISQVTKINNLSSKKIEISNEKIGKDFEIQIASGQILDGNSPLHFLGILTITIS